MFETSWPRIKVPCERQLGWAMSTDMWLHNRRVNDGADGLWRIHDHIYDLNEFIRHHPGGSMWLTLTKGTDITEAFEAHHLGKTAENKLPQFHVKKASTPRNSPFTFDENGFYRTLKNRVGQHFDFESAKNARVTATAFSVDFYFFASLILAVLAARYANLVLATLAGLFYGLIVCSTHNFVHMKDSFRNYYYYFVGFSVREWRITHCLSHHLFPNTLQDLEISMFEPAFRFLPEKNKPAWVRFGCWIYFPIIALVVTYFQILSRIRAGLFGKEDCLVFVPLVLMLAFGKFSLATFYLWLWILAVGGFTFVVIGLTAAHHDPDIFHEGDKPRKDTDWGLFQVDTIRDRIEIVGNKPVGLLVFGEHTLHHLFPTIDFYHLQQLTPIFHKTLEEFGIDVNVKTYPQMIRGAFAQMARNVPNLTDRERKRE